MTGVQTCALPIYGKNRGIDMFYYQTGQEKQAFIGWDDVAGKLFAAANVGIANEIVSVSQYGSFVVGTLEAANVSVTTNISTGNITGTGLFSTTGNVVGANVNAGALSLSGNVISALAVTGNISSGNIDSTTARITSIQFADGTLQTTAASGSITAALVAVNANVTAANAQIASTNANVAAANSAKIGRAHV